MKVTNIVKNRFMSTFCMVAIFDTYNRNKEWTFIHSFEDLQVLGISSKYGDEIP